MKHKVFEVLNSISEQTFIPLSLVLLIIGGVAWLTNMNYNTEANGRALESISNKQDQYNKNLEEINTRLSRLEGYIKSTHGNR